MSAPTPSPGSGEWVGSVDFPTRGNQFRVPLLRSQLGACPERTSPSLCFGRSHLLLLPSSLLCLSGVSSGGLAGEIIPPQLFPKLLEAVLGSPSLRSWWRLLATPLSLRGPGRLGKVSEWRLRAQCLD